MVAASQLPHNAWKSPIPPVSGQDHDIAVRFGDESVDNASFGFASDCSSQDSTERCPTFGPRDEKIQALPVAVLQARRTMMSQSYSKSSSSAYNSLIDDEFDSVLMSGLQEFRLKILHQHRSMIEALRKELNKRASILMSKQDRPTFVNELRATSSIDNYPTSCDTTPTSRSSLSPTSRSRAFPGRASTKSVKFGTSAEVEGGFSSTKDHLKVVNSRSATGTAFPIKFSMRQEWLPQAICRDPLALQQTLIRSDTAFESSYSVGNERASLGKSWSNKSLTERRRPRWKCMLHPRSPLCLAWLIISLLFLSYDGIVVPVDVCFTLDDTDFMAWFQFFARVFWTLDIFLRFSTGITINGEVEMDPTIVFFSYMKGWFIFDLLLVGFEWALIAMRTLGEASLVSLLRSVRWLRVLRILRLLRVLRFAKVNSRLHELMVLSTDDLNMTKKLMQAVGYYLIFLHLATCVWYGLGDTIEGGWVSANGMRSNSVLHRYTFSLHWVLSRLQGYSRYNMGFGSPPTAEVAADCVMLFTCLLVSSWFVAIVLQVLLAWAASNTAQNYRLAKSFMDRHRISRLSKQKTLKFLQANQVQGPGEVMMDEARLMNIFPPHLQHELLYETKAPLLCTMSVFYNLHTVCPRVVRHLCHDALFDQLVVEGEVVFANGDGCNRMYLVRSGKFKYAVEDQSVLSNTPRPDFFPHHRSTKADNKANSEFDVLCRGQLISEAALWTFWEHMGELSAITDGLLINVEFTTFLSVITQHKMACVFACKYARHFIWSLNRSPHCDLIGFDFTLSTLDQSFGAGHDHFIFITHYKMEAGTEATLMRDLLEPMIRMDSSMEAGYLRSPIFIDSEDLADLTTLKKHVEGSDNLIVLLTPDVLTRPYCLVELVTAKRHGVQLVPVEVQRPGLKYQYPNEEFYSRLRNGKVISPKDSQLLRQNGCSLREVEEAIHMLFLKIALPFSPHKSGNVRHAELDDILKRCQVGAQPVNRSSMGVPVSTFNFTSFGLDSADENGGLMEFSMNLASYAEDP